MKILKRILIFLAIVISVLWIEVAHADMSAPEIREFEIVVINPEGVDYYDYKGEVKGHLNKDDVVLIEYEYNGTYTIGIKDINQYGREYTKSLGDIKSLEGFSIVQKEVDPTKVTEGITKLESSQKARVYASDGVDIYKGPSNVYEKVGHIKKDVVLTYDYVVSSTAGGITHIYIEYNGQKGWVEILGGKVLIQNDAQYIFMKDVSTECGIVPRNSITTPYYKTDTWSHEALFQYNGCEFIHNTFRDDDIYYIVTWDSRVLTSKEVTLYEYADKTSKIVGTIPAGSEVVLLASNESFMSEESIRYIKYGDIVGWSIDTEEIFDYQYKPSSEEEEIIIEDTIEVEEPETPVNPMISKKMSLSIFILLCAFGVGLLVITALVIIILINRSNKLKKEEDNKEEK